MSKMVLMQASRLIVLVALIAVPQTASFAQSSAISSKTIALKVTTDRKDALYEIGETATFTIEATQGTAPLAEGKVVCVFSKDGWKPEPPRTIDLSDGKATLAGKLDEPGFLQLSVTLGEVTEMAAAGYDPLQLKPSMPIPDDFDEFWAAQKAALAKVPVKQVMKPVEPPAKGMYAFDVQVDCLGKPVSGYFGRPYDAKPKSLPAVLVMEGAGVRSANLVGTQWSVKKGGMLSFDINAHGVPNGKSNEYYSNLYNGELKNYRWMGNQDRERCYFKEMFLRSIRAIDFLTSQPEWDGKTVIVNGGSQGAFQAIAAAGLDSRVTFVAASVPAGCDHTGRVADRISGWPGFVPIDDQGNADPVALQTSRYFDCVNFASRVKCKGAAITVGFIDTVCPPTSIYVAYNNLPVPKEIYAEPLGGHVSSAVRLKFLRDAAYKHIGEKK